MMMVTITFPDELAKRLQQVAERENRTVAEIIEAMLDRYEAEISEPSPYTDPLLRIWEMAHEANLTFTEHDVSTRSREILETEYADYLLKRMRNEDDEH